MMERAVHVPPSHAPAPAPPCTLVIFGITGDLTHRLLMPALYNLALWKRLPDRFRAIGIGRTEIALDALRDGLTHATRRFVAGDAGDRHAAAFDHDAWDRVIRRLDYVAGDIDDRSTYRELSERIGKTPSADDTEGNVLFYLAVAPKFFGRVVKRLGEQGLSRAPDRAWRRIVIEKPFGHDLASAQALNRAVLAVFDEDQVFRMDHFLGKETVQNIMAFRFGNGLFEPLWNRDRIDHVQITVAETVDVGTRGTFYDATGALRDMVPNHLFQLFTMMAMEPPISFAADAVRSKKEEVLMAVPQYAPQDAARDAVRAQYTAGSVQGRAVGSYREAPHVDAASRTETYVALRLTVDNWRWAGVPFYLRTGKAMARRDTEISIRFKQAPLAIFRGTAVEHCVPNWLVLQIQPDEGISLHFGAKVPGPDVRLQPVAMDFRYRDFFATPPSTGYETLIYDAMVGDATLFQRAEGIEGGWRLVQPLLDAWSTEGVPMATYRAGSAGPREADELLARDGRTWRPL